MTIPSRIKTVREERRLQVVLLLLPLLLVNENVQLQVQSVKLRTFITLPKYIPQENQCGSE